MNALKNAAVLLARITICAWFLPEGIAKMTAYEGTAGYMAAHGVPGWLLPLVILTEIGCAVFLLVGWQTRVVAFLLAGYTVLTVLFFHMPAANPTDKIVQMAELVDAAGFLVLCVHGAGDWSLDAMRIRRRKQATQAIRAQI